MIDSYHIIITYVFDCLSLLRKLLFIHFVYLFNGKDIKTTKYKSDFISETKIW